MRVVLNINKKYFLSFALVALVLFGLVGVIAFGTNSPSNFGHTVSEIDWSGTIGGDVMTSGNVKASGFCIGTNCVTSWPSGSASSGSNIVAGSGISVSTLSNGNIVINSTNSGSAGTTTGGNGAWTNSGANTFYNGNVGIGTSTPSVSLDVAGNTKITGDLSTSGNTKVIGNLNVSGHVILPGNYMVYRVTNSYCLSSFGILSTYASCTTRPYAYVFNNVTNVYEARYYECNGGMINSVGMKYCPNTLI